MAFGCIRGSSFDENLKLAMLQDIFKYAKINSRILHELDRIKEDWLSLGTELKESLQAQVSVFEEKRQKKKKQSKNSSSSNSNSSNQSNRISDIRTRRKKYKQILNRIIKWKYIGDESLVVAELDVSTSGREEEKEVSKNQSKTKKKSIVTQHETKLKNFQDLVYYHNFFTHTVQQLFHHHRSNNEGEHKHTKEEQTRQNFIIQSLLQNLRIIHQSLLDIISVVRDLLVENDNSLLLLLSMYNDLINNTNVNGITVNDSAALLVSTSTGSLSSSFSGLEGQAQAQRPQSPQPHSSIISSAALSNLSPTPSFTSWNSISCKRVLYSDYTDEQTNFFFNSDTNQNLKVLETATIQIQKQNQGENDNGVQYLLSGHDDGKIKIFNITNYLSPPKDSNHTKKKKQKKKDSCVVATLRGHSKTILSLSVHKTNDAYYLVSSSIDGTINVYNLDHSSSRFDLISTLYFSWNNITECHSLTTTIPILREKTKEKDNDDDDIVKLITTRLKSFQTSNNNNKNNNTNSKSSLFCPIQKQQKKQERIKKSNNDSDKTNSISTFLMCSVSEDYCIHIWDPISQTLLHTFDEAHSDTIFTICIFYRPSGSGGGGGSGSNHLHPYLASGSFGRDNIKIWDLETYTLLQTLHLPHGHHSSGVKSITIFSSLLDSFSSSSSSSLTILADARLDKRIHLWRLKEENEHSFRTITDSSKGGGRRSKFTYMTTLVGHNNPIHSIDFIQVQGNLCLLSTTNNDHGVYNNDDDDDDIEDLDEDLDEEEEKNHNDEVGKLFVWNLGRSPFNVNKMMPIPTKINVTNNNSESSLFSKRKNPLLLKIIPSVYLSNSKDSDNNGGGRSLDNSNTSATSTKKQRACILTTLNDGEIYFWME